MEKTEHGDWVDTKDGVSTWFLVFAETGVGSGAGWFSIG